MKTTTLRLSFIVLLGTLLVGLSPRIEAGMHMFQDTTFLDSDWVASKWADTTPSTGASFTAGHQTIGGSPLGPNTPDYRQTSHTYDSGAILVEHRNVNFNWTPQANEVLTDIDFRYDLIHETGSTVGGAVGYGLNIYQGGKIFRSQQDTVSPNTWTPFNQLLLPLTSFEEVTPGTGTMIPTSHPAGNLPMSFGYMSANSANGLTTKISGIDNFKVTLWTVPEPSAAVLVFGIALVLCRLRRRG